MAYRQTITKDKASVVGGKNLPSAYKTSPNEATPVAPQPIPQQTKQPIASTREIDVPNGGEIGKESPNPLRTTKSVGGQAGAMAQNIVASTVPTQMQEEASKEMTEEMIQTGKTMSKDVANKYIKDYAEKSTESTVRRGEKAPTSFKEFWEGMKAPEPTQTSALRQRLAEEYGTEAIEGGLNNVDAQIEELDAATRKAVQNARDPHAAAEETTAGRISDIERNQMERRDSLVRERNSLVRELNTKTNIISQIMQDNQTDYANASQQYNTQFSQAMQMQQMFMQEKQMQIGMEDREMAIQDKEKASARANLQVIYNNIGDKEVTPQQQAQINQLEAQAGMPIGTIDLIKQTNGEDWTTKTMKEITKDGKPYFEILSENEDGSFRIQTIERSGDVEQMGMKEQLALEEQSLKVDKLRKELEGTGLSESDKLDLIEKKLKIEKLEQEMQQSKDPTEFKEFKNESAAKAYAFGSRMSQASDILNEIEGEDATTNTDEYLVQIGWGVLPDIGLDWIPTPFTDAKVDIPNFWKSDNEKSYEQAARNWVNANLRKESGATISDQEFSNAAKQYFAQPGDSASIILQKRDNRELAEKTMIETSGYSPATLKQSNQPSYDDFKNNFNLGDLNISESDMNKLYQESFLDKAPETGGVVKKDSLKVSSLGNGISLGLSDGQILGGSTQGNNGQCGYVFNQYAKKAGLNQRVGDTYASKAKLIKKESPKIPEVGGAFISSGSNESGHIGVVTSKSFKGEPKNGDRIDVTDSNKANKQGANTRTLTYKNGKWISEEFGDELITGFGKGTNSTFKYTA